MTESKKFTNDDGSFHYKKHKIYLYKEDFTEFNAILAEMTDYIVNEKGQEVISERHQKDYVKEEFPLQNQKMNHLLTALQMLVLMIFNSKSILINRYI